MPVFDTSRSLSLAKCAPAARNTFWVESRVRNHVTLVVFVIKTDWLNGKEVRRSVFGMTARFGRAIGRILFLAPAVPSVARIPIASLMLMRTRRSEPKARQNIFTELRVGFGYIIGFAPIRSILTLIAAFSLLGFPYTVLLPVFASTVLHGGPHTLGFLTAASGTGALISAITLALRKTIVGLGKVISVVAFTFGAALIALGISRTPWLSLPLMLITGFSMMQMMAASNTIMQTILEEDKRGRVMSFYSLSFMGILPFGSLISGALADKFGAPTTVIGGGALCIAVATWFSMQLKHVRRIVDLLQRNIDIGKPGPRERVSSQVASHHARLGLLPLVKVFPAVVMNHDRVTYPLPCSVSIEQQHRLPAAVNPSRPDLCTLRIGTSVSTDPARGEMWRQQRKKPGQVDLSRHHRENAIGF